MADTELQRTIRRSTAVLALLLSLFILLFQGYLAYQGLAFNLRNMAYYTRRGGYHLIWEWSLSTRKYWSVPLPKQYLSIPTEQSNPPQ